MANMKPGNGFHCLNIKKMIYGAYKFFQPGKRGYSHTS